MARARWTPRSPPCGRRPCRSSRQRSPGPVYTPATGNCDGGTEGWSDKVKGTLRAHKLKPCAPASLYVTHKPITFSANTGEEFKGRTKKHMKHLELEDQTYLKSSISTSSMPRSILTKSRMAFTRDPMIVSFLNRVSPCKGRTSSRKL